MAGESFERLQSKEVVWYSKLVILTFRENVLELSSWQLCIPSIRLWLFYKKPLNNNYQETPRDHYWEYSLYSDNLDS